MTYLTQQQYETWFSEAELIQLTDRENAGVVDVSVFDEAVDRASKRIDSYINSRYSLPLSVTLIGNSPISDMCGVITRYLLNKNCVNEELQARYEDAVKWLKDISAGRVSLGETDTEALSPSKFVVKAPQSNLNWDKF